jgi:hypothetical protein
MDTPAARRDTLQRLRQQQQTDLDRLRVLFAVNTPTEAELLERERLLQGVAGRELTLQPLERTVATETPAPSTATGTDQTSDEAPAEFTMQRAGELFETAFDRVAKEIPLSTKNRLFAELFKERVKDAIFTDSDQPKK